MLRYASAKDADGFHAINSAMMLESIERKA